MAATAGSTQYGRDVVYTMRFAVDPGAKAAAEEMAKIGEETSGRVARAKRKETDETKKGIEEQKRSLDEYRKGVKDLERAYETAGAKWTAANAQFVASSKQALEGVVQLGRGMMLVGISSERDLKKAVQAFAGFEAGVNILKGVINTVEAGTKAWLAYRAAVQAANAATGLQAGLAAFRGAALARAAAPGGVVGDLGGNVVSGVAEAAAGGGAVAVAGTGAAKAAGTGIAGLVGAIVTSPAFIFAGIAAGVEALGEAAYTGFGPKLGPAGNLVMSIPGYRGLAEGLGPAIFGSGDDATIARQRGFLGDRNFRSTQEALDSRLGAIRNRGALAGLENSLAAAGFSGGQTGASGQLAGVQRQLGILGGADASLFSGTGLLDRQINLRQQELQLVRQIGQEEKSAAQERIRGLETQLQTQQRIAEQIRGQVLGAAERFGQLSGTEQQRTIEAQRRLQRGERIGQDDRQRLRALGLDSVNAGVRSLDVADARRAGFDRFFGGPEGQRLRQAEAEERRLTVAIAREQAFVVQVEADTQQTAQAVAAEIARLMAKRDQDLAKQIRDELRRERDSTFDQRNRDAQNAFILSEQ